MKPPKTLADAIRYFTVPENCREYLVSRRWPNGVTCPTCGSKSVYFDSSRNGWECKTRHPKRKFTLKTGTIFEDSPLGLDKWLPAVWMIANMKNGVAAHEITARSASRRKPRGSCSTASGSRCRTHGGGGKLGGEVEVDETFIGGKARNMHAAKRKRLGISQSPFHDRQGRRHGPAGTARREGEPSPLGTWSQSPEARTGADHHCARRSRFDHLHRRAAAPTTAWGIAATSTT